MKLLMKLLKHKTEPKPIDFLLAFILVTAIYWISILHFDMDNGDASSLSLAVTFAVIFSCRIVREINKKRKNK